MGVLDKIKNALFEVEYVEVEEPPKKEKKKKEKIKQKKEEKPIAKKVVLPGKREEKIEEIEEEELRDEDFEIRPKNEVIKEPAHDEFKFMDDKDFQVEDDYIKDEPEIVHVLETKEVKKETKVEDVKPVSPVPPVRETREKKHEDSYSDYFEEPVVDEKSEYEHELESKPYGVDNKYQVSHEYGLYEKKEEKPYFQPSPIISPIYGILDKNYKKEDVREKKEVRITTNYSRSNMSVDDIRNKAYGNRRNEKSEEEESSLEAEDNSTRFEIDEEDDNLLVDLSDRAKPEVKELTMGDALEYFQDLGLEYNVDYVDVSKDNNKDKKNKVNKANEKVKTTRVEKNNPLKEERTIKAKPAKSAAVEIKNETKKNTKEIDDDNDNLFDLIDSMYQESN